MKKPNYYKKTLFLLESLHKKFPSYNMGKHFATALDGEDLWGISDRELFLSLQKYEIELELDVHHEDDVEKIIKDSMHLSSEDLLKEE